MTAVSSFPPLLGYVPREHIASGGQSSVFRALNPSTNHLAAIKVVPLNLPRSDPAAAAAGGGGMDPAVAQKAKQLVREMRIHETLDHRNILRLFGGETRDECHVRSERGTETSWPSGLYMVLDLAPDVGVDQEIAHLYFRQLIAGLKYLNGHGICHRDVKPENCLLDGQGNLKVSDFGLATVFKYKGQERLLKDRCGSPPYAAPELARAQPYAAEPIDVWSAGVVLFALLFGNTPWDEPTPASPEFAAYLNGSILAQDPWRRLGSAQTSAIAQLVLKMLTVDPERRPRLKEIERMEWYLQPNSLFDAATGLVTDPHEVLRRLLATLHAHEYLGPPTADFEQVIAASQQPPTSQTAMAMSQKMSQRGLDPKQSFRSSLQQYSRMSMAPTQRTNPNTSRFFTTRPLPVLVSLLSRALATLDLPSAASASSSISPSNAPPPFELLYSTSEADKAAKSKEAPSLEYLDTAPLGTLFARFRIVSIDRRREPLQAGLHITKSILPAENAAGGGAMDVDGAEHSEAQLEGLDITFLKRKADPLEMKRLWRKLLAKMPEGVIVAT
ncbi:Chk1 protein kinase [Rhodotorula sphaerocarpa]